MTGPSHCAARSDESSIRKTSFNGAYNIAWRNEIPCLFIRNSAKASQSATMIATMDKTVKGTGRTSLFGTRRLFPAVG